MPVPWTEMAFFIVKSIGRGEGKMSRALFHIVYLVSHF